MREDSKQKIIANYSTLLGLHGDGPAVTQNSEEGQRFRFGKIVEVGDLRGKRVLDLGCGIGDLLPVLRSRFDSVDYTGVDIVPGFIRKASLAYPGERFVCADVLRGEFEEAFDYVLVCGVFNNAIPDSDTFIRELTAWAFAHCRTALAFNFISSHVNFRNDDLSYHDPAAILDFCIRTLSRKVVMHHHYERCDVAAFIYR